MDVYGVIKLSAEYRRLGLNEDCFSTLKPLLRNCELEDGLPFLPRGGVLAKLVGHNLNL